MRFKRQNYIDIDKCSNKREGKPPYTSVFHEVGHSIDLKARKAIQGGGSAPHFSSVYDGGKFPKTICREIDDWIKSEGAQAKAELPNHMNDPQWLFQNGFIDGQQLWCYNNLGHWGSKGPPVYTEKVGRTIVANKLKSMDDDESACLSDIVEGATDGKVRGKFGHLNGDPDYWSKRTYSGVKDGLASEVFSEMTESTFANRDSLVVIQKYLPDSYSVYEEMLQYLKGVSI